MRGLLIHLLILSNVLASSSFSSFSNCFKYDYRCLTGPLIGWSSSLHHQYGVEWASSYGWYGITLGRVIFTTRISWPKEQKWNRFLLLCAKAVTNCWTLHFSVEYFWDSALHLLLWILNHFENDKVKIHRIWCWRAILNYMNMVVTAHGTYDSLNSAVGQHV